MVPIPKDRIQKRSVFKRSLMYDPASLGLEPQDTADPAAWLQAYTASPGDGELPPARTSFVRKWTVDEAVAAWTKSNLTGNPVRGKTVFATARCVACHGADGTGGLSGPDLTSLVGRFSTRDIATSVIEPSKVINEKYVSETLELANGSVVIGRVVRGDDRASELEIVINLLRPEKTVKIDKADVVQRKTSPVSAMPSGLLDCFNEDEIIDLIAYVLASSPK